MTKEILDHLSDINGLRVHSVYEDAFKTYGRVVSGFDFSELFTYMDQFTRIPEQGNVYVPSVREMEQTKAADAVCQVLYGEMPVQIGYCNGRNITYNGFEYHKCSEINIAVTDFMLVLGHIWDMKKNSYRPEQAEVFYLEKGTAIEMYQTTLHLSPCRVTDEGFKDIVILLKGTNLVRDHKKKIHNLESELLLHKNKWIISHKDRESLIQQGAFPGLLGENRKLLY